MADGCDISEHQGPKSPEWFEGYDYVILRAFNEWGNRDRVIDQNWANAAGRTLRGVYGWPVPGGNNFVLGRQLVTSFPGAEAMYWADREHSGAGLASEFEVENYLRGIEAEGGKAGFYSNVGECPRSGYLDGHDWWIANYGPNDGGRHDIRPAPPRPYTIHQYSSNPIDLNWSENLDWTHGGDMPLNDDDKLWLTVTVANLLGLGGGNWVKGQTTAGNKNQDGTSPSIAQVVSDVADVKKLIGAGGGGGGLTEAQVRGIVHDELKKAIEGLTTP